MIDLMHKKLRKIGTTMTAVVLASSFVLTGCSSEQFAALQEQAEAMELANRKPNVTVSDESKWYNSAIKGAIDDTLQVRPQDDFYTAINRDYVLETSLAKDEVEKGPLVENGNIVLERKKLLVSGDEAAIAAAKADGTAPAGLSEADVKHLGKLVHKFAELAGDWEKRDADGVEPLRPYIDRVQQVSSLDDMTQYLMEDSSERLGYKGLIHYTVDAPALSGKTHNAVILDNTFSYLMDRAESYSSIPDGQVVRNYTNRILVENVLMPLGYTKKEVDNLWRACMRFEVKAAEIGERYVSREEAEYLTYSDKTVYTMDDIAGMQGLYPMTQILSASGLGEADDYRIDFPSYFKKICKLYTEKNVEDMKAYFIVHLALDGQKYLRRSDAEQVGLSAKENLYSTEFEMAFGEAGSDDALLYDVYFQYIFAEPLAQYYSAVYSTEEDKAQLLALTERSIATYEEIIKGEDWLTEETKQQCIRKLQMMTKNVLYPDEFVDYSGLELDDCSNLLEAVKRINAYENKLTVQKLSQSYVRGMWRMSGYFDTTLVNATYNPNENSMNIYAGLIANGEVFDKDVPLEQNMARIGTVIGHEISHSLDPDGRRFNEYGDFVPDEVEEDKDGPLWWTREDKEQYDRKVDKLTKYFTVLPTYRDSVTTQFGMIIKGEAIADVTGVKIMLEAAKDMDDFDYRTFFESYAQLWRQVTSYNAADLMAKSDVHPLNYKRVNVSVQQFDEFYKTYDVKEGDGMYLPKDKRLLVW